MFRRVETGYCLALFLEPWDAPPGRFFTSYRARHGFRGLMGNGVVDEFRTTSAPLFVTPTALLGKVYDTGMLLGERRDPEAPIDLGWPPLCMGLDQEHAPLTGDWQAGLLDALTGSSPGQPLDWPVSSAAGFSDAYAIECIRCGGPRPAQQLTILGTNAPLLPGQLDRLCDIDGSGLTVAIATGNRVVSSKKAEPQRIESVSEAALEKLIQDSHKLIDAM